MKARALGFSKVSWNLNDEREENWLFFFQDFEQNLVGFSELAPVHVGGVRRRPLRRSHVRSVEELSGEVVWLVGWVGGWADT